MPFKHVTQIDDKSAGNRFHMLPLPVCVDLEPRAVVSGEHSQRTIICVSTSSVHTLQQTDMTWFPTVVTVIVIKILVV